MICVVCGGWRDCVQGSARRSTASCLKFEQFQNISNKIILLAFINMCLNIAKSSTLQEEQRQQRNITLQMVVCGFCLSH